VTVLALLTALPAWALAVAVAWLAVLPSSRRGWFVVAAVFVAAGLAAAVVIWLAVVHDLTVAQMAASLGGGR